MGILAELWQKTAFLNVVWHVATLAKPYVVVKKT